MTIKGRKALQSDNEELYRHNVSLSEEVEKIGRKVQTLHGKLRAVLGDLESLLKLPLLKAIIKLIKMKKEYKKAKAHQDDKPDKSQSG